MYYEVYWDSIFISDFIMNFCILHLMNNSSNNTASYKRICLGSLMGSVLSVAFIIWIEHIYFALISGAFAGCVVMLIFTFKIKNIKSLSTMLGRYALYASLLGGGMLLSIRISEMFSVSLNIFGICLINVIWSLFIRWAVNRGKNPYCQVEIKVGEKKIRVNSLIDSGNSLWDPISGVPVSVMDEGLAEAFFDDASTIFRFIPYHSIGCDAGVLKEVFVDELLIYKDGTTKKCEKAAIAISNSALCEHNKSIKLILNPNILN